ncbi:hypothetical protein G5B38_15440 [Pseudohalocynthiibacter aestuariivivens]|nr:hypothetical protein [Pseudohalocynthiibacter aestuariivivens]QIE46805.1 hypothetical protein G5B38_15440 [Pseudohalocynthiibacter aestuariivivens]
MRRNTMLAAALIVVAPWPASAQVLEELTMQMRDSDAVWRMQGGFAACLGGFDGPSEPAQTVNNFTFMEWNAGGTYGGLTEYNYKDSTAIIADDGTFCEIADFSVTQSQAAEIVRRTFAEMGQPLWPESKTAAGCTAFTSPTGRVIEVSSGGQDPICGDTPTSAIRVWNEGQNQ